MTAKFLGLFIFLAALCVDVKTYKLEQVVVLGRHNIRTPLTDNLEPMTTNQWPKWPEITGYLTSKGAVLEGYMGGYFSEWLKKERLFTKACPTEDLVYIYANAPQRTLETAKMFTKTAFKNCNLTVHYKENVIMDPVFYAVIRNSTETYKNIVINDMKQKLNEFNLTQAYLELNKILDLNNSKICINNGTCDLTEIKDNIIYDIGGIPNIIGALAIGNSVVDSFLMEFYNGHPSEIIAWGSVNQDKLKVLSEITKAHQNIRFNTTNLAKDTAKPLIRYMSNIFLTGKPKFTLLVGHDLNLYSVMAALSFKPYELPNQFEKTPIGGKLVFQKWYDNKLNGNLMKINYVYQSMDQLRNSTKLTMDNPPNQIVMELNGCSIIDSNGYCLWDDFIRVINSSQ